jgi:hypothetical protein
MIDKVGLVCFCFPLETYHILLSSITLQYTLGVEYNVLNLIRGQDTVI